MSKEDKISSSEKNKAINFLNKANPAFHSSRSISKILHKNSEFNFRHKKSENLCE